MISPLDRERMQHAKVLGSAAGLKGVIALDRDVERQARHRAEWPELWARIDQVTALVDWR